MNAETMAETYSVQLFGRPRVMRAGDGEISLSPQELALLALCFGGASAAISREEAAEVVWGQPDRATRHRLSQVLYSLRRKTGVPLVVARGETLFACREAAVCDVWLFQEYCERQRLEEAWRLIHAGLLTGLEFGRSHLFEEWVEARRSKLHRTLRECADDVWSEAQEQGAWNRAVKAAAVSYALEPWNERFLRRLMASRALAGQGEAAVAVFEDYIRANADSDLIGNVVEEETVQLLKRIQESPFGTQERALRGAAAEPCLWGRDKELRVLRCALLSDDQSRLRFVVVRGEAGIGKTRLIEECLKEARLRGALVLSSSAAELERAVPLNALLEALSAPAVAESVRSLSQPWRGVLIALMPDLAPESAESLDAVPPVHPSALQRRLLESIRQLFLSLAESRHVILFLDDFHWADDTSVAALEYLRRRWLNARFTALFSVRSEEVRPDSVVSRFLRALQGWDAQISLDLDELPREAAGQLVREVRSGEVDGVEASRIYELAGGNPFFLIELALEDDDSLLRRRADPFEVVPVPLSVTQVIEERISRLSPHAFTALGALAIWARPVSPRLISSTGHLSRREVVAALEELQTARLVRWRKRTIALRHELVRQTIYRTLSETRKAWLHGRAARYLIRYDSSARPEELALHCDRAGDRAGAFRFALEAATRAERTGATLEAIHLLTIARRNAKDPEEATDIIGRLARLHYLQLDFAAASPLLELAVRRYRSGRRTPERLMAEVWRIDALSRSQEMPVEEVEEQLAEIKREAREAGQWEAVAEALDVEWHFLDRVGETAQLQQVLKEGEQCVSCGSARAAAVCHRALAVVHQYYGDPQAAFRHCVAGVEVCGREELHEQLLRNINAQILVFLHHGILDTSEGKRAVNRSEGLAAQSGDLFFRCNVRANVGVWFLDIGELERAEPLFAEAASLIGEAEASSIRAVLYMNVGELCYEMGRIDEAVQYYGRFLEMAVRKHWYSLAMGHAGLGLCAIHRGDLREARRQEELLRRVADSRPVFANDPSMIVRFQARMMHRRGDTRSGVRLLEETAAMIRHRQVPNWIKLKLEAAQLLRKLSPEEAAAVARDAHEVAAKLGLERRCEQLQAFLR